MTVFRVNATTQVGENVGPIWVKADSPTHAVEIARSNGLILDGEAVTAAPMNGNALKIDFGSDVIAVGESPEDAHSRPPATRKAAE